MSVATRASTKLTTTQKAAIRKSMKEAFKAGKDISTMATCSESYKIALKIKSDNIK